MMAYRDLARVKKRARLERRSLVWVDEAGFYVWPTKVRSDAPRGQRPPRRVYQTRAHLSLMSALSTRGYLFTLDRAEALTAVERVRFLKPLRHHLERKRLVMWDGSPIHRADELKAYLANGAAKQIHLERLPGYVPELNPAEGVWHQLKGVERRNVCCVDLPHWHHPLYLAVLRLRRKSHLIQSFLAGTRLTL